MELFNTYHGHTTSNISLLISHELDKSVQLTELITIEPLTGLILKRQKIEKLAGVALALLGPLTTPSVDHYYIVSSKIARGAIIPVFSGRQHSLFTSQGPITCIVSSTDGEYYVGSVNEKICVWESLTGTLLCILAQHFQSVAALRFTQDGQYLISGGRDGMILVWNYKIILSTAYAPLQGLLNTTQSVLHEWSDARIKWTFSQHALPVTTLHTGTSGLLYSGSADRSCRVWDLLTGDCIATLQVRGIPTAITTDLLGQSVYIGLKCGNVQEVQLTQDPTLSRTIDDTTQNNSNTAMENKTHKTEITGMIMLRDNKHLVSSDESGLVITWDVQSLQPLKKLEFKAFIPAMLLLPGTISHAYSCLAVKENIETDGVSWKIPHPQRVVMSREEMRNDKLGVCLTKRLIGKSTDLDSLWFESAPDDSVDADSERISTNLSNDTDFNKLCSIVDLIYNTTANTNFF